MYKRLFFLSVLTAFLALGSAAFAQTTVDLNDRLYTDLELWQGQGLIDRLPPLRPYPIQLVKKLLAEVVSRGSAADRRAAVAYLAHMDKLINASIEPSALARAAVGGGTTQHFEQLGLIGTLQGTISPTVTYSAKLGAYAMNGPANSLLPLYQRPPEDVIYDGAVAPLGASGLTPRISLESQTAFGSDSTYFQTGIMRDSFGPFYGDSIVLSPTAPQSGNLSFTWEEGLFTYTSLLLDISATPNNGAGGLSPDKFLALHSLEFYPTSWLTLGIYESVVWGGRFEPLYLLPIPAVLFYAQGMVGFPDNSFIGLSGGVKLPASLRANAMLYVDDASFNDLVKLHLNTMLVVAGQGGLSWTPNLPLLKRLSVNYTLVTPYTYSHQNQANDAPTYGPNFENYTNAGQNMATSLEPDSDRIEIDALLRPLSFTDVTLFGRFIRHGNGSYGVPGLSSANGNNGTIFDDGYAGGSATFAPGYNLPAGMLYTRFLTQPVIEKTIQVGFDAKLYLNTPIGRVDAELAYTFEYVMNVVDAVSGNPQSGVNATNNYVTVGAGISF